jgi:hypothetical protein
MNLRGAGCLGASAGPVRPPSDAASRLLPVTVPTASELFIHDAPKRSGAIPFGLLCLNLFRRYAKQPAGIAVFEHPERAVQPDLYVTNAMADVPAFHPLGGRAGDNDANAINQVRKKGQRT